MTICNQSAYVPTLVPSVAQGPGRLSIRNRMTHSFRGERCDGDDAATHARAPDNRDNA